jgi:hypothetical protein
MKVNKTISLPVDTAERLEQEANQSAVVRQALQDYWGEDGDVEISLEKTNVRADNGERGIWKATVADAHARDVGGETPARALRALADEFERIGTEDGDADE